MNDAAERRSGGQEVGRLAAQHGREEAQRAAMGDDDTGGIEFDGDGPDTGNKSSAGLATGWGEVQRGGGPGVEVMAGDVVPGAALPGSEVHLLQPVVELEGADGGGQSSAPAGGAAEDAGNAGGAQGCGQGGHGGLADGGEVEVEAAVAMAGGDLAGGVAHQDDGHGHQSAANERGFSPAFEAELAQLFRWRRDVRRFRGDPVDDGLFGRLLATAWLAPSVGLSQPWRFVTVDDPRRRAAIRADFARCNAAALAAQGEAQAGRYARLKLAGLDRAPRQVAVFVEPDPAQGSGLGRHSMAETVAYSAVLAIHTLWLAARAAGLGLGWVSILDQATVAATLEVDPAWQFIGYLCIGYPERDSTTPELESRGWEKRRGPDAETLIRR